MATVTFQHAPPARIEKFRKGDYACRIDSLVLVIGNGTTDQHFSAVVILAGKDLGMFPGDTRSDFCNNAWDQFHGEIRIKT